ncbi:metal-dependent hydrolase [Salisaeta longa]|uniref:metal-dependent hydrolase n=1 Tax=Salisaeta longa TaxID=503170 RepID=UPI0003B5A21B|nr:metal-dependent hydrolase [Salisaeta longa]
MTLTYFGHSTFQIETGGTTLLFDPFFNDNPHTETVPADLSPDVVLLSHAHFDHYADIEGVLAASDPTVIGTFEVISRVGSDYDHEKVQPLNEGGTVHFDWGSVEAVHARHTSSFPDGSYGGVPVGFVLELADQCVYYTGDTAPFAEMQWIGDMYDVDLMLAPIGDTVTMGIEGALMAADMVDPALFVPVHYNTFPFNQIDLDDFTEVFDEAGFDTHIIPFGGTLER